MASSSASVYACRGRVKISCTGPLSTTRPACSTDTVSASWRTSDRSWETNR